MLEVSDDSGFLALIVPATYESFVDTDWKFDQLMSHFQQQMKRSSLVIWGTGMEGLWRVDVRPRRRGSRKVRSTGFREVWGPLHVSGGKVLVTNYESLTMAAQFADVRLPEEHQSGNLVEVPDGPYACRVIQNFDPEREEAADGKADFVVELREAESVEAWDKIPWFEP